MNLGIKEVGPIIMTGGGHGGIGGRMRSHSFADATLWVPNSNRSTFQRRNTIDTIDNQATSRKTSSANKKKHVLSTISCTAKLSSLSLHSTSDTDNQVTESASDTPEEHHERNDTQSNIRQLYHEFSFSCSNPWTEDFIAPDYTRMTAISQPYQP